MSGDSVDLGVDVTTSGGVATVTMRYPARRNALSLELREVLHDAVFDLMADPEVRVLVLTGAEGVFSAGGDISGMDNLTTMAGRARLQRLHRLVRLLIEGEKPVIAAVEGYAVGAGMSLAAACEVVVAAEDVVWNCAFNKLGLMPDMAAIWTLPARMGLGRAKRLMLTSEQFDTDSAADWGLVEEVTEPGAALATAQGIAKTIAKRAPAAVALTKTWLSRGPMGLNEALAAEADAQAVLFQTEDFTEGRTAFMEKRVPEFKGR